MKKYLIVSSLLSLTACTAHVGYNDLGQAFRGISYAANKPHQPDCAFYATRKAVARTESEIAYQENLLGSLEKSLSQSPAWNGSVCQRPAPKPIPAEPKGMSLKQAEFQAIGACLDLLSRRHATAKVMQSLLAVRQEQLWTVYEEWKKHPPASCAVSYMPSQSLDFVVRMCGAFGYEASNACLMDYLSECNNEVLKSCRSEHTAWQNEVAAIKAYPDKALQECQSAVDRIASINRELPNLHMTAQLNREEHGKLSHPRTPENMCR